MKDFLASFKMPKMRFRYTYMILGSLLVTMALLLTDPDTGMLQNLPFGSGTIAMFLITLKVVIYVALLHLSRKALFDYPEADFQKLIQVATGSPVGAGLIAIALSIATISIALLILASTK